MWIRNRTLWQQMNLCPYGLNYSCEVETWICMHFPFKTYLQHQFPVYCIYWRHFVRYGNEISRLKYTSASQILVSVTEASSLIQTSFNMSWISDILNRLTIRTVSINCWPSSWNNLSAYSFTVKGIHLKHRKWVLTEWSKSYNFMQDTIKKHGISR